MIQDEIPILKMETIPKELQKIKYPPKELFYQGRLELLDKPKIAIVGTRRPNQYSRRVTYILASQLSKLGIVVVSGGAIGTDIIAHRGAFPNTISVMANSLDIVYPKSNRDMIQKMAIESLLISESERGVTAHPKRFIHRNRLIIGLSDIVIVIEADKNSGSARNLKIAEETRKPLYVLPHRLDESLATNEYLEQGKAKAIYNIDHFLDEVVERFQVSKVEKVEKDEFMEFCKNSPTYEEAFQKFGDVLFEKELYGEVEIINGRVIWKGKQ